MAYTHLRILAAGAILCSLVGHPLPVSAEMKSAIPDSMFHASPDKRQIASRLRLAAGIGKKVLAGLEASPRDNSIPMDESVMLAARETYALIRAARAGLEMALGNQKFPDPVDQLSFKKLDEAWNLSRYPLDALSSAGLPREQYLSESIQRESRALQLVNQVLVLLP